MISQCSPSDSVLGGPAADMCADTIAQESGISHTREKVLRPAAGGGGAVRLLAPHLDRTRAARGGSGSPAAGCLPVVG